MRALRHRQPPGLAGMFVAAWLVGLPAGSALAHEDSQAVRYTVPEDGSEVQQAPATVVVEFTFDVAADFSFEVVDDQDVDYVASARIEADRRLVAELDPLGDPGVYLATYDVGYARQDGHHRQRDTFSFLYTPPGRDPFGADTDEPSDAGPAPPPPAGASATTDDGGTDDGGVPADNPRPGDLADGFVAASARERPNGEGSWWSNLEPVQRTAIALVGGAVLLAFGAVERWTRPSR